MGCIVLKVALPLQFQHGTGRNCSALLIAPCYSPAMPNRSSKRPKRPRDPNQLAWQIVQEATGQAPKTDPKTPEQEAAALLGRLGGLKGGRARASSLSATRRSEIARKAAAARWRKKR